MDNTSKLVTIEFNDGDYAVYSYTGTLIEDGFDSFQDCLNWSNLQDYESLLSYSVIIELDLEPETTLRNEIVYAIKNINGLTDFLSKR